ncbi:hypothetical protein E3N88_00207 [Mikania micrantha]|uniref:Uncharacterized protein n=1 Tax=Mikania micrantha TaxID=192012 RepID=A0A5N6PZF0_9ASTR|nr:hypothetical protein E3N88_00207 [Mikania micrantha]
MDPSRYAEIPWRKASRYAAQIGSRDSRIPSRYAAMIFDRPSRHWSIIGVLEGHQHIEEPSPSISRTCCTCYNPNPSIKGSFTCLLVDRSHMQGLKTHMQLHTVLTSMTASIRSSEHYIPELLHQVTKARAPGIGC